MSITIRGLEELQAELDKLAPGPLKKTLQKGTTAGGQVLKPHVKAAAPKRTGALRKSVSAVQARRERPASIVKVRKWYRHFVIQGTKPHRIRFPDQRAAGVPRGEGNIRHPGAKANPFIDRVANQYELAAVKAATDAIEKELP